MNFCQQCNQPIKNTYKCIEKGCLVEYCSSFCEQKDKREHGHTELFCGKYKPFYTTCKIINNYNCGVASNCTKINKGDLILVEKPSMTIGDDVNKIPKSIQQRITELEPRPHSLIEDKFQYNGFHDSLFLNLAMFNHSCLPNADCYYFETIRVIIVFAIKDIEPDEEITINYLSHFYMDRQQKLFDRWNFKCSCLGCTNTKLNITINVIANLYQQIMNNKNEINKVETCKKIIELYLTLNASPMFLYEIYMIMRDCTTRTDDKIMYKIKGEACMDNFFNVLY